MLNVIMELIAAVVLAAGSLVAGAAASVDAVAENVAAVTENAESGAAAVEAATDNVGTLPGPAEDGALNGAGGIALGDLIADGFTLPVGDDRVIESWDLSAGGQNVTVEKDIRQTADGGSVEVRWSVNGQPGGFRISPDGGVQPLQ